MAKQRLATLDNTGNVPVDQLGNVPSGGTATVQGVAGTSLGSAQTIDFASTAREVWLVGTFDANLVVTLANRVAGARAVLMVTQPDAGGPFGLTVSDGTTSTPVTIPPTGLSVVEAKCTDATNIDVALLGGGGVNTIAPWAANENVVANQPAQRPSDGALIISASTRTTRASYDATEANYWNVVGVDVTPTGIESPRWVGQANQPAFGTPWANTAGSSRGTLFYMDGSGLVHIELAAVTTADVGGSGSTIFTLPAGYIPSAQVQHLGVFYDTAWVAGGCHIIVEPTGGVYVSNPSGGDIVSGASVSFCMTFRPV